MKLLCAPMATISHAGFRFLTENFGGCDEYYTEMIHAPSLLNKGQFEKFYINPLPVPKKVVWQLTGKESSSMADAALILCEQGGMGIDLNMGCCAPEIVKSGAGIAWMLKEKSQTEELLKKVRSAIDFYNKEHKTNVRFSVKCRLGDENFTDDSFFSFTDMLVSCGVQQITLHPRTKKEKYRETPRYIYAERLSKRVLGQNVSVIVNGDIADLGSAKKVALNCPTCSGMMIGCAAVQKPWIFRELSFAFNKKEELEGDSDGGFSTSWLQAVASRVQVLPQRSVSKKGRNQPAIPLENEQYPECSESRFVHCSLVKKEDNIEIPDLLLTGLKFVDYVTEFQPKEFYKTRLQRFFSYYADNFSFAHFAKTALLNAASPEETKIALEEYIKKQPEDRFRSRFGFAVDSCGNA